MAGVCGCVAGSGTAGGNDASPDAAGGGDVHGFITANYGSALRYTLEAGRASNPRVFTRQPSSITDSKVEAARASGLALPLLGAGARLRPYAVVRPLGPAEEPGLPAVLVVLRLERLHREHHASALGSRAKRGLGRNVDADLQRIRLHRQLAAHNRGRSGSAIHVVLDFAV